MYTKLDIYICLIMFNIVIHAVLKTITLTELDCEFM